ncbi:flagellar motor switch protein FliG [Clostridium aminobutyricum]|uniref:Flagellar motor switch protein FliG n=1 Tax=Clostridium aminobutyricum TaxID=33953 RepID=A0A939IJ57_CLOAM|nr:flagellar motor switch protein FliG [Clostridium aminobutyricum]MBN7773771.1 flagellar motor switch protein FliG [Clostridium aminobutyricum]
MSKEGLALTPQQKAAAVVISLGADRASKIYKHLNEDDLELLTLEIAKLNHVTATQTEGVLDDFYKLCLTQKVITDGGVDYARTVLEKAFGAQTATTLLERVTRNIKTRAFEFIRKTDSKNLFAIIQHERPQTIALILSYARANQASDIITELPKEKQVKVVECIARMDSASPETIKIVEKILERKFASVLSLDFAQVGGVDYIADVMNNLDRGNEKFIFDELSKKDIKLADEIRKKMFVFEDITLLDNRAIQEFLREAETQDIVYALKGSNQEVSNMIFSNMSSRMAETVKSELEFTYNVRLKDVEEAQQKIVAIIRRLEEEGRLVINKGGKDEIIA